MVKRDQVWTNNKMFSAWFGVGQAAGAEGSVQPDCLRAPQRSSAWELRAAHRVMRSSPHRAASVTAACWPTVPAALPPEFLQPARPHCNEDGCGPKR